MKACVSALFLFLSCGISIVPSGICPGCITPHCLFKNGPPVECSCCEAKTQPKTAQWSDGKKCCYILSPVLYQSASTHAFASVDAPPALPPVSVASTLAGRAVNPELHLTGPPQSSLFITHRSLLI